VPLHPYRKERDPSRAAILRRRVLPLQAQKGIPRLLSELGQVSRVEAERPLDVDLQGRVVRGDSEVMKSPPWEPRRLYLSLAQEVFSFGSTVSAFDHCAASQLFVCDCAR